MQKEALSMSSAATSQHFFLYLSYCTAVCVVLLCGYVAQTDDSGASQIGA